MKDKLNIFWFRRDLRLEDNKGLYEALRAGLPVLPLFIFDKNILDELEDKFDRRVDFIHKALENLQVKLVNAGYTFITVYGDPEEEVIKLTGKYEVSAVFTNHDYEPYAINRDKKVKERLQALNIGFHSYKDQVIFERNEVIKDDGGFYSVFTPYSRKWKSLLYEEALKSAPSENFIDRFFKQSAEEVLPLEKLGFKPTGISFNFYYNSEVIANYEQTRNIPAVEGTSRVGVHLRFGTISIRKVVAHAVATNETFLNELIWREFFMQALWHQPRLEFECFKKNYDKLEWRNNEEEFRKWSEGKTGYPIVDAGMRELNATGFMHNRVRMITASFLVKHLLIDWRWGEAYFAKKLMDYELASNIGNWQWVAGCGCDAAPYFRIFSPDAQVKKFDPKLEYINKWVPELNEFGYPVPMVDHAMARERCLRVFKAALAS